MLTEKENQTIKTVFITGGANGIGRACARRFAAAGWRVAVMDICDEPGDTGDIVYIKGSVRSKDDLSRAIGDIMERFGRLDCLVANAGVHRSNTILDITDEELDLVVGTNLMGTINTLRAAVPKVVESGGGSVVIMASDQSTVGKAHSFAYGLTKGALGQMAKSLAIDLAPKNIRVNAVCPSTIATPLVDGVFERCVSRGADLRELWDEENAIFLRGSVGRPEEVAAMVCFLASDEAGFCTGGLYPVDGGYTCM